jgi:hypothetical protein
MKSQFQPDFTENFSLGIWTEILLLRVLEDYAEAHPDLELSI